ncbi:unnamed protein product [Musa acuminata subsp. burmannicoides]
MFFKEFAERWSSWSMKPDALRLILHPARILLVSLEKTLIPRYRILDGPEVKGVHIGNLQMSTYMLYPEKKFLEKFVIRHKEFPELIELYNVAPKTQTAL